MLPNNTTIQSNSLRGNEVQSIVSRTIDEIMADLAPAFGPGASDYFLIKNKNPYYTRDGMEIFESLAFDNELSREIHHFMFQSAFDQAQRIGDGTTSLTIFNCLMYKIIEDIKQGGEFTVFDRPINEIREAWKVAIKMIMTELEKAKVEMTPERLLSMLYTCTQDKELAASIYYKLKDALMAGAYIIPRQSNIATDFNVTTYTKPVFKATRQYSVRDVGNAYQHATILYCKGILDIAHFETIIAAMYNMHFMDGTMVPIDIIILCHGMNETTRKTLRALSEFVHSRNLDTTKCNNFHIYTLDEYRSFSPEEIEDIATIISDEPGLGGLVKDLTFETLLYRAFYEVDESHPRIDALEIYDMDPHLVEAIKKNFATVYQVVYDEMEGLAIGRSLGPVASARYEKLRQQIKDEKSEIVKYDLQKRMRRTYGQFIEIEVGSTLLKDTQRKYELILDAIISSAEGVENGVLVGNSLLHAAHACNAAANGDQTSEIPEEVLEIIHTIGQALLYTVCLLVNNLCAMDPIDSEVLSTFSDLEKDYFLRLMSIDSEDVTKDHYRIIDFDTRHETDLWPSVKEVEKLGYSLRDKFTVNVYGEGVEIDGTVVEPFGIIKSILEKSILPIEISSTRVFHISGMTGFMNNFID